MSGAREVCVCAETSSLNCPIHGNASVFPSPDPSCPACAGDGWYVDHEHECYEDGCCSSSGVQRQCESTYDARAASSEGIAF